MPTAITLLRAAGDQKNVLRPLLQCSFRVGSSFSGSKIRKGNKPGHKVAAAAKTSPEGNQEGRQAWETRWPRQPRAAQKGDHEGDKLRRQGGTGSQEQPMMEIMKGDKLGRQGGSGMATVCRFRGKVGTPRRQRQPRAAQNGDHEGRQAWETRRQLQPRDYEGGQAWTRRQPRVAHDGDHEGRQAWETRRQRQPTVAHNGDHPRADQNGAEAIKGRQAWETRRQRQPRAAQNGDHEGRQMKGDKVAAAAKSSPEWSL